MTRLPEKHLHIIAFDIPYPVNYGGAIDIFYKIKSLKEKDVKIHLHCFKYGGRKPVDILNEYCFKVYYYPRKHLAHDIIGNIPYIINSRKDEKLLECLLLDDYPILFEGLHSCYYLAHPKLKNRKKIVRTHNIEHEYYAGLAKTEKNHFRKLYFINESNALKIFEKKLRFSNQIAVISQNDYNYFSKKYKNVFVLSAFHPNKDVNVLSGKGKYALYHGSLEVNENHHAAMYLVENIFNDIPVKLIIAGSKPKRELLNIVEKTSNIEIYSGLSVEQIHTIVKEAQINILPTFQATGIKLKLLLALYQGRHCVVNTPMVINTGLEELCHIADDTERMKKIIIQLFHTEIEQSQIIKRKEILMQNGYMNDWNANLLIDKIF